MSNFPLSFPGFCNPHAITLMVTEVSPKPEPSGCHISFLDSYVVRDIIVLWCL